VYDQAVTSGLQRYPDSSIVKEPSMFQLTINRAIRASIVAAICACSCSAQGRSVALTFDDLPIAGEGGAAEAERINDAILSSLSRHHARATGFVIEEGIQEVGSARGSAILRRWVQQGHDLGNHTFSHPDFNTLTIQQFENEIIRGEASFARVLREQGRAPRYLRFPYNHTGDTNEKRKAIADFLAQHGYSVAVCTIDNSDYEFARAYRVMLQRKDTRSAGRLRAEYLAYTDAEIDYYTSVHRAVFGREIPHVMLLHANRLNAALLDHILARFERKAYRFVNLDEAQSDPAYATHGTAAKGGIMWGYRWAGERGVKIDGRLEPEPPEWVLKYGKR
jgi:peptidoglycan/xylan/chitin deacetylase (PgdA/CDA1 family)